MSTKTQNNADAVHSPSKSSDGLSAPVVGWIVGPGGPGEIVVEHPGAEPAPARLLTSLNVADLSKPAAVGRQILLIFEGGNPHRPIIVGVLQDPLEALVSMEIQPDGPLATPDPVIDGKRVTIEAQEEITLKCGAGSITLRKDGKVLIKGTHLLSRSAGPIRIKGARVDIN